MTTPLYIFDLDGTLCDNEHRKHLVVNPGCDVCGWRIKVETLNGPACSNCNDEGRNPGWRADFRAFDLACGKDAPIANVVTTLNMLWQYGAEIWFMTGRMDVNGVRELCEEWLVENTELDLEFVNLGQLNMRAAGDDRADHIVKQAMLDAMLPEDRARLVAVYDDRHAVVQMWRRNGITCFQCAPGNF